LEGVFNYFCLQIRHHKSSWTDTKYKQLQPQNSYHLAYRHNTMQSTRTCYNFTNKSTWRWRWQVPPKRLPESLRTWSQSSRTSDTGSTLPHLPAQTI